MSPPFIGAKLLARTLRRGFSLHRDTPYELLAPTEHPLSCCDPGRMPPTPISSKPTPSPRRLSVLDSDQNSQRIDYSHCNFDGAPFQRLLFHTFNQKAMERYRSRLLSLDMLVLRSDPLAVASMYYSGVGIIPQLGRPPGNLTAADKLDEHFTGIRVPRVVASICSVARARNRNHWAR
jgi:hypothetical protein